MKCALTVRCGVRRILRTKGIGSRLDTSSKEVAVIRITLALLLSLLAADAAADGSSAHMNEASEAARAALGTEYGPRMAYLPEEVLESAGRDLAVARLCEIAAQAMDTAKDDVDNFAVAAVNDDAQMLLLHCLDETLGATQLPKLRLVFVGNPGLEPAARAIVESWGATFFFAVDHGRFDDQ